MDKFISLSSDGKGNIYFFDCELRQRWLSGDTIKHARTKVYNVIDTIDFENKFYRTDIGKE